ncbi:MULTISPECIES: D-glycero-beta-D-manno-heptose 1-phosphate adenylyltransferase [unclassified Streptomyces]|uniref:D-glycero-beta-D-manno-heptose 1-phosphate adenylyltransferase n=1 Tax=unclassified Streptomyces TaxID=2593676 RepID=UPI0036B65B98
MNRGPLVVVGDLLLDEDIEGEATRLAPDAPAPVVDIARVRRRPGGAGLAALLAARHGGEVVLVAAAGPGDHEDGARARRALGDRVRLAGLPLDGTVPVKTRVLAGGRPLVRLDRGGGTPGSPDAGVFDALRSARAVLVSDYGRGTADVLRTALGALAHKVPVVWDPHPRGGPPVPGTRLATPNAGEAALFSRLPGTSLRAHADRGADLAARWEATHVAVTLGARGALLTRADAAAPLFVPAVRATTGDPCGAGDCFAATAAAALADGALPEEAVERAVAAAAAFVAAGGAAAVGATDGAPADGTARTPDPAPDGDATALVRRVRARGGTVVATGGCFDLLHAGHVRLLESAGRIGDCLIVCVNSDASVARLKGPGRPLTPLADRMRVLAALASVDAVLAFDEDTPERLLATLRPDVWVKGGDYTPDELPEAELLRSWGGQTVVLPYLDGRSTTSLAHRAARSAHTPAPAPPPATR